MNFVIGPGICKTPVAGFDFCCAGATRYFMRVSSAMLLLLLAACRTAPPATVAIEATSKAISQLSGKWVGDYSSAATGRSGSIVFELNGNQQTARGDVIMYTTVVNLPADQATRSSHAAQ